MFKRIFLFLMVNVAVITTISIVTSLLGVGNYIGQYGLDISSLLVFCTIWGFTGSFISLLLSKTIAKWSYNIEILDPYSQDEVVVMVKELSKKAGIETPEVGVYDDLDLNAFATGMSRNSSLVAVSSGLLNSIDKKGMRAIIAHEISHIANGDMVTMTLVQGVVNSFTMFLSRVIAFFLGGFLNRNSDDEENTFSPMLYSVFVIIFDILFSILGSLVVSWYSRIREYSADHGSAILTSPSDMANALLFLGKHHENTMNNNPNFRAMMINTPSGIWQIFSTHPTIEQRIARLKLIES